MAVHSESDRLRPLLVGEAPSRTSDPAWPFSGRSGDRLRRLLGRELEDVFDVANVFDEWPGSDGKGARWNRAEARLRVLFGWDSAGRKVEIRDRDVVCVGRRVADALGGSSFARRPYFEWVEYEGWRGRAAILPHPSGVNRFWNVPENVERATAFLTGALWSPLDDGVWRDGRGQAIPYRYLTPDERAAVDAWHVPPSV